MDKPVRFVHTGSRRVYKESECVLPVSDHPEKKKSALFAFPARVISGSFALVIIVGTVLLMMPFSSKSGAMTPLLDSLYTATSATCVTGLIVYDTFTHWSLLGQCIILALIQIGGLGLVTFTTFFNIAIGKRLGLKSLQLAQESISLVSFTDVTRLVKMVVFASLGIELIGAMVLSTVFVPKYGGDGMFISLFLAVSSFCNAGFDVLGREAPFASLTNYQDNPLVLFTISILIIIGGLGFVVWNDLYNFRKTRKLLLHTKIVLAVSAGLILIGMVVFLALEWSNPDTLGHLNPWEKITNSYFQSVSARTAGFNSVNLEGLHDITKMFMCVLMFIGAAPGSTGGGIKITTFIVIVMTVLSVVKGHDETILRRRRVPQQTVYKALTIVVLAMIFVGISTCIITFGHGAGRPITGIDALFESVSAFATVGLSVGVTNVANSVSLVILLLTMFVGRVGPVSFALSIAMRSGKGKNRVIPEAKILVG